MDRRSKLIAGASPSLWKSLAVKSLRLGWPEGFYRARAALRSSANWRDVLWAATWEDLWPSVDQLADVAAEVTRLDVEALCGRDTHHGARQLSSRYASLAAEVEPQMRDPLFSARMAGRARELGVPYLGPRALSEFAIWLAADPPSGGRRPLDEAPWRGIPASVADMHTAEGRRRETFITILCGHPDGHIWLAREVAEIGWDGVRAKVHGEEVIA